MNRYCPNCRKPRVDELPLFCNDQCEEEYNEWVQNGGDVEVMKYEKEALKIKE
jgi:endogenous inhibitor of DNA gyrase (YacG/DUF329 family)